MGLDPKKFGKKQRTRSAIGKASKNKGKVGEREVVHLLDKYGFTARRGQQFQGSPDSPDVICDELKEYHIEVKRTETLSIYKAIEQSSEDAGEDQSPIVFHRRNEKPWLVILEAKDFLTLVKAYKEELS